MHLRENTGWVKTVEDWWKVLVGTNTKKIVKVINGLKPLLKTHKERFRSGDASRKIVENGEKDGRNRLDVYTKRGGDDL